MVIGTAAIATRTAVSLSQHAERAGANGLIVNPQSYWLPTQDELFEHYRAIGKAVSIPVMVYNSPGTTKVDMSPAFIARLAGEFDHFVAVKESSGDIRRIQDILSLNPLQAREERIWAYLCHFDGLEYMRARWPIPDDDKEAVKHILTHYFATSARAIERDNGISRLWWMGFIANRAQGLKLAEALKVLMYRADVRANIIERPTTSASVPVFSAILRQLKSSFGGKKHLHEREYFRACMKEINSVGGVQLLDSLGSGHLDNLMKSIISSRLGLTKI